MSNLNKPAFPVMSSEMTGTLAPGMSLLEYFAARAPAEPQAWFKPVLPAAHKDDRGGDWVEGGFQYNRLRLIQWPFAWARAVLAAGEQV